MLHEGTKSQHFGYVASRILGVIGKAVWKSARLLTIFISTICFLLWKA